MNIDQYFDIFIAFHGDRKKGTLGKAEEIYYFLRSKGYNAFVQTITNEDGAYKDTHRIIQHSKLFLFVVNSNVNRNGVFIERNDTNGYMKRIWQEIDAFRESESNFKYPDISSRLYLCSDINESDYSEYTKLDTIFNGKYCLHDENFNDLNSWVSKTLGKITLTKNTNKNTVPASNWNSELALTWHNVLPPLRPSPSEVEIYREYLKFISSNSNFPDCNALILGTTNEFRKLFHEERFNVTIVDISEDYHNEISNEIKSKKYSNERVVYCNWLDILNNKDISEKSYDIIIGDLAIGNINPEKLNIFLEQISNLLKDGGFFLGKTIFSTNHKNYTQSEINNLFDEYLHDEELQQKVNLYEYSIYPLALFATDRNNKVNFTKMYSKAKQLSSQANVKEHLLDLYIGETTSFKDKMKMDFYVYPIKEFLNAALDYFYIYDVKYAEDYYSSDFPLFVLRKGKNLTAITYDKFYYQVSNFLSVNKNKDFFKDWTNSLTSQYFLANITTLLVANGYDNFSKNIQSEITEHIRNGMIIALNSKLNCQLDCYFDMNIVSEILIKVPELNQNEEFKKILQKQKLSLEDKKVINNILDETIENNYIYGMLCYLTWFNSNEKNHANNLVEELLFSYVELGQIWEPKESLWVSARICVSVFPMFYSLSKNNQDKLYNVFVHILYSYDYSKHLWMNYDLNNSDDNFALCLNALLCFNKIVREDKYKKELARLFKDIIDTYVLNLNIYDTSIKYYVGEDAINCAKSKFEYCNKINNSLSFISSIVKLIVTFIENNKLDNETQQYLVLAKHFLINIMLSFWEKFKDNIIQIDNISKKREYSLVSQIIYSLIDAVNFDDNAKEAANDY